MATMKCGLRLLLAFLLGFIGQGFAQNASFNFTGAPDTVAGWTNVSGDPSLAVRSVTAPSGITISSVATANWSQYGDQSANNGLGENSSGVFPAAVLYNHWYSYDGGAMYQSAAPQLIVSGLNRNSVYSLQMAGSSTNTLNANPTVYTVVGLTNYGSYGLNNQDNVYGSVVFSNVSPDSTGRIRIYVNTSPISNVADICGLVITSSPLPVGLLRAGMGVAQAGQSLALGDSVARIGPHAFTSNRYQYLNGYQYSIGGTVKEPAGHPVARLYDNGDLAFSTTMDTTVNTETQSGLRFHPRTGLLQVGATDRGDSTLFYPNGAWPGGGILMNSDDAPSIFNGQIVDSYLGGGNYLVDTTASMNLTMLAGQVGYLTDGAYLNDFIVSHDFESTSGVDNTLVGGLSPRINNPVSVSYLSGYLNGTVDTAYGSLAAGSLVQFGGLWQTTTGVYTINRTPGGVAIGSNNVNFSSLSSTGLQGLNAAGLAGYPLFSLGNMNSYGSAQSNALTVLYNGRMQINTTGYSVGLTQPAVTPQAALDVVSTNSGVLFPRLTTVQQDSIAISDLQTGLLLYNTDSSTYQFFNAGSWKNMGGNYKLARWTYVGSSTSDSPDNIGIGTSNTQGYKWAVNGDAVVSAMNVKPPANWPDGVFLPGYHLRALPEVAQYVRERHHLPEVESGEEVENKGVSVAEQQALLLKKVEELTLYVIDLNKRAAALRRDNARLKKQYLKDHAHKNK